MPFEGSDVGALILIAVLLGIYFFPAIVAFGRNHRQVVGIIVVDLFLGWTLVGWVIALVWALSEAAAPVVVTAPTPRLDMASEIERFAKLRDQGLITDEEFAARKRTLLG
jgi:hypothetical protein